MSRASGDNRILSYDSRETLEGVHITLHYQFLEQTKSTENLKWILSHMQQQYKSDDQHEQQQEKSEDIALSHESVFKRFEYDLLARGAAISQVFPGKRHLTRTSN